MPKKQKKRETVSREGCPECDLNRRVRVVLRGWITKELKNVEYLGATLRACIGAIDRPKLLNPPKVPPGYVEDDGHIDPDIDGVSDVLAALLMECHNPDARVTQTLRACHKAQVGLRLKRGQAPARPSLKRNVADPYHDSLPRTDFDDVDD